MDNIDSESNLFVILKTDRSFLSVQPLSQPELVKKCIEYVQDKLKRPTIMSGKENQRYPSFGFFSDYSTEHQYAGKVVKSITMGSALKELLDKVNHLVGATFNSIVVNQYRDGNDIMEAHSYDPCSLDPVGVVTITYGAVRTLLIREKVNNFKILAQEMKPGELYHMGGDFQKQFTHEIKHEKCVTDVMYSFTFRRNV